MMYELSYERLQVWQHSRMLVKEVYGLLKLLPQEERYALSDQLRRAVVSVSSNIAEGSARVGRKEKGNFYGFAYGSLMEVACQLTLAQDLQYIDPEQMLSVRPLIEQIARELSALRKSLTADVRNS